MARTKNESSVKYVKHTLVFDSSGECVLLKDGLPYIVYDQYGNRATYDEDGERVKFRGFGERIVKDEKNDKPILNCETKDEQDDESTSNCETFMLRLERKYRRYKRFLHRGLWIDVSISDDVFDYMEENEIETNLEKLSSSCGGLSLMLNQENKLMRVMNVNPGINEMRGGRPFVDCELFCDAPDCDMDHKTFGTNIRVVSNLKQKVKKTKKCQTCIMI